APRVAWHVAAAEAQPGAGLSGQPPKRPAGRRLGVLQGRGEQARNSAGRPLRAGEGDRRRAGDSAVECQATAVIASPGGLTWTEQIGNREGVAVRSSPVQVVTSTGNHAVQQAASVGGMSDDVYYQPAERHQHDV